MVFKILEFLTISDFFWLLINVTEVTTEHQKLLRLGTHRIKVFFLPKGQNKPQSKPSAGARSKPT